jgi:pimeloyl-ACP methyl ester carboxylesterase
MGGMIVQTLAIEHPEKVLTMTSIMSTTGDRDVGQPTPEAMQVLLASPPGDRAAAIDQSVAASRVISSPVHFDDALARARAERSYDRSYYPAGIGRQLLGIVASGSRSDALRQLDVPTLVIHGAADPLVQVDGGRRTAEATPGAELLVLDEMGHDLPRPLWPQIIDAITALTARVPARA